MKIAGTLVAVFFTVASFAQDSPMKLSDAVKIALDNNIRLQQEQNNLLRNKASLQAAKLALAPTISAQANAGSQTGNSFNQQEGQVVNGTINFVSGSFGANMPIFNGFGNRNSLRSTNALFESQENNLQRTEQEIISQVAAQFLETLLSQELLKLEQENLQLQKTNLEKIENEVELGAKAEVDRYNQISLIKTGELNILRAEVTLRNNLTTLAQIMQIDPNIEYTLIAPSTEQIIGETDLGSIDLESQLSNRKDLVSLEMIEQSNRYQMMATKSTFMPSLDAFANYGSRYNQVVGFAGRSFNEQFFTDNTYVNYGLALNVPIFNGMRNKSQYVRDKIAYENSILDRKDRELTIKSDIQRAYGNYQDAIKSYELARSAMEAAEMSFQLNKDSYELGLTSLVDFSLSNRDFFQAKSDMIRAKLTLTFQDILLKDALGTLTKDDIID